MISLGLKYYSDELEFSQILLRQSEQKIAHLDLWMKARHGRRDWGIMSISIFAQRAFLKQFEIV